MLSRFIVPCFDIKFIRQGYIQYHSSANRLREQLLRFFFLQLGLQDPIVVAVRLDLLAVCYRFQLVSQKLVIGFMLEMQASDVKEHLFYLSWKASTKHTHRCRQLLLCDSLILLFLVCCFEVLPGQVAPQKVDQHVDHAL